MSSLKNKIIFLPRFHFTSNMQSMGKMENQLYNFMGNLSKEKPSAQKIKKILQKTKCLYRIRGFVILTIARHDTL